MSKLSSTNNLSCINLIENTISTPSEEGEKPGARDSHTVVKNEECLIVFGGYEDACKVNTIYEYNTNTGIWRELIPTGEVAPVPRSNHSAVCADGVMWVFGGADEDTAKLGDLWKFHIQNRVWTQIEVGLATPAVIIYIYIYI